MDAWVWWVVAAVVLVIVEMTTLDLVFVMLAGGAVTAAVVDALGGSPVLDVAAFVVVSVALLGGVRPVAKRHLTSTPATRTGVAALIGAKAVVTERVDAHAGRVKIAGEVWSARSYDGQTVLEPGESVDVIEIQGATALVL